VSEDNKALVRRFYEGIVNDRRLELAHEVLDPAYIDHAPMPIEVPGPEGFKRRVAQLHAMFAIRITREDMTAEDDRIAFRWTIQGEHIGEFAGIEPTGRAITITGLNLERIANERIVEHWSEYDQRALMDQIGSKDR
jgi:predicted ester cyclase